MQTESSSFPSLHPKSGVCVVDGYGVRIRVDRKHLVVSDGIGRTRRERRFSRATSGLKRIVVLGHTGYVSLEAFRWMADVGIGFVHIDGSGRLLVASSILDTDKPALRRAQALAMSNDTGIEIVRWLLAKKVSGQGSVAAQLDAGASEMQEFDRALQSIGKLTRLDALMMSEAQAANAYWSAWESVPVLFARRDETKLPDHWRVFGKRSSPVSGRTRLAANPANALLNYLYALLEAEARFACLAVGLDPGLGILHADQWSRDSLALDVMEAVRPDVDAYVLKLLRSRAFRSSDFHESRQGVCRILPPLTHELTMTLSSWRRALGPVAERVAQQLATMPGVNVGRIATPMTESNRSRGRPIIRRTSKKRPTPKVRRACRECGAPVTGVEHCPDCTPEAKRARGAAYAASAHDTLRKLRDSGEDPSQTRSARDKQLRALAENDRANRAWDAAHTERPSSEEFRRDILPLIQDISLAKLARATGLSVQHCGEVRRGKKVPHPRHWDKLRVLTSSDSSSGTRDQPGGLR